MSAGQKERVAGSMVRLMMDTGKLKDYLTDLMELEVKRIVHYHNLNVFI
jgi:hypothetical protein